jgi:hypothetical protein
MTQSYRCSTTIALTLHLAIGAKITLKFGMRTYAYVEAETLNSRCQFTIGIANPEP